MSVSEKPDLILLDLGLPDLDGMEVIKSIRSWSLMPIIVVSARGEDTDKIHALDAGADDYLTKPFAKEELKARIEVMIRRNNPNYYKKEVKYGDEITVCRQNTDGTAYFLIKDQNDQPRAIIECR